MPLRGRGAIFAGNEVRVGCGRDRGRVLHQAVEQQAPGTGPPVVVPECELVEVVFQLPGLDAVVVGVVVETMDHRP